MQKRANIKKAFTITFVLDGGKILPQALLLAKSLCHRYGNGQNVVAAIPESTLEGLNPKDQVLDLLKAYRIEVFIFENPYLNQRNIQPELARYANKILALTQPVNTSHLLFLDSDILCLRKPVVTGAFTAGAFCARQAGTAHITHVDWEKLYQIFNLKMPSLRVPCITDGVLLPPYFNSGVIGIRHDILGELQNRWKNIWEEMHNRKLLEGPKLTYADQAALALAVQDTGVSYAFLNEDNNYRSGRHNINPGRPPFFAHYHSPEKLYRDPELRRIVQTYLSADAMLRGIILNNKQWQTIFGSKTGYWRYLFRRKARKLMRRI